ncbi:MAG TPA: endonuclease MutS2 [Bacillota bacterium]|nr:endonuclease MutS2 [Bacillota bacterium]
MNERTLRVLEFNKVIDRLKDQALTTVGKELSASLRPFTTLKDVVHRQEETDEAVTILRLNKTIPLGGIIDIRASIKRSTIGGILTTTECLDVANTIYGGRQVKNFMENFEIDLPLLEKITEQITPLKDLENHIKSCIDEYGNVLDRASPKLHGIRSSIRTFEKRVRDKLDEYTKTKTNHLSEAIVTIRNNRYVLPVKQESKSAIGGIVHDQSASGQTLFMEPKVVVDVNNKLQEALVQEKQEIERILRKLSEHIASLATFLTANVNALGQIDFIFARAKLGQEMKAARPTMNDVGFIKMKQARHPLIPIDEVVANDIELGRDYTTIVITGPNTGGKTVTLKMVGLCTVMAQSGLQVPALDGCELAVFEDVFADIGDEQSIEQSLSTFSSHMTNIVDIMKGVNDQSLVLFDELGAGTDPQEGAALAISILDEVISKGARVIATTHYPELKAYGYNRDRVINASVEFDVETLQPTYRLLIGVPGRSNAFEISKRLGLQTHIIEQAKSHVGVDSKNVEQMIASLEDSKMQAEKAYEEANHVLQESERLHEDLQTQWDAFQRKQGVLYQKAEEKAGRAIEKARQEAESIVGELRQMKTSATLKEHEWIEAKKQLEEAQPELLSERNLEEKPIDASEELTPGDHVKLLTVNQPGTVLEKINDDEYMVQVGMMRVNVKRKDLHLDEPKKKPVDQPVATVKRSSQHVKTELDLRGERFEDALIQLEKYIDDVMLAGYEQVTIIHGKGTGALRKGVQTFAKNHPSISSYRAGKMGEGGSGVTILQF